MMHRFGHQSRRLGRCLRTFEDPANVDVGIAVDALDELNGTGSMARLVSPVIFVSADKVLEVLDKVRMVFVDARVKNCDLGGSVGAAFLLGFGAKDGIELVELSEPGIRCRAAYSPLAAGRFRRRKTCETYLVDIVVPGDGAPALDFG